MAAATGELVRKHFRLNAAKIERVKEIFEVSTDTEAVNRALDFAIEEHERNRMARKAHRQFVASGNVIHDALEN